MKLEYFKHYSIRPLKRGWNKIIDDRYKDQVLAYCPLCERMQGLVSVGFMNYISWNKVTVYPRCEYCLLKLPVKDKKIMRLLGWTKKHLPKGQTRL